jgi:Novel STAND NTPase 1/TIR domain
LARLFISHSSANNAAAIALRDWLFELGYKNEVFLDIDPERGLAAGERWQEALRAAADRCEAVLFLVSRAWLASAWCRAEFLLAKNLQKRIFGLIIECIPRDQVPVEMTAEWQICELVGEDRLRTFDIELGVRHEQIAFRETGLEVLRRGLERAGLDAKSFPWPPRNEPKRAPYRGLRALEAQDAAIFFGRDASIVRGLDRIRGLLEGGVEKLLVVLGASGSGKSSFLRAGLLPRLDRDDAFFVPLPVIRPEMAVLTGEAGLAEALADTFERLGAPRKLGEIKDSLLTNSPGDLAQLLNEIGSLAKSRLVAVEEAKAQPAIIISIDQAEELFNPDATAESGRFLALLARVLDPASAARVLAIATIRSDRYQLLQTDPHLTQVKQALFNLTPMPSAEFKSVIEGPAQRVVEAGGRLEIEAALTEQLIADAQGADALPLLAFSLEALYRDNRSADRLMLSDYARLGGVQGSITAAISRALAEPGKAPVIPADTEGRYACLRATFIPWLARIDPATGAPMRRLARLDEFPESSVPMVERLVRERLLIADQREGVKVVEVAHESLLRRWPALASWLETDAANLKLIESVERAAGEWEEHKRLPAWLDLRAERLTAAESLATRDDFRRRLGPIAPAYLAACRTRENAENRRRSLFNNLVRAAAVLIAIVAGIAVWQWIQAANATKVAETQTAAANNQRQLASQRAALLSVNLADKLLTQGNVDQSLLLLLESAKAFDDKTAPDKIRIAFQSATDRAQTQKSYYLPASSGIFSANDSLYVFDYRHNRVSRVLPDGELKYLGPYSNEVREIRLRGQSLIVLRADFNVDVINMNNFGVRHLGPLIPPDQMQSIGRISTAIYSDGLVLARPAGDDYDATKAVYIMDIDAGRTLKAVIPSAAAFRYLTTASGQRVFATENNGFVYATDTSFTALSRAETLDKLWDKIYLCAHISSKLDGLTKQYVDQHFQWVDYDGDHCATAGDGFVFIVHKHHYSAGTDYSYNFVDTKSGKSIDITSSLLSFLGNRDPQAPADNSELSTIDMISRDKMFAASYNRELFVFTRDQILLRTKLENAPSVAKLLSKDLLAVVQKTTLGQKITLFSLGAHPADSRKLSASDKAALKPLHNGSCTGYTRVFPKQAILPDGSTIVFDTHTPTSFEGNDVIKIEKNGDVKTIDLKSIYPDCVEVNSDFSYLLIKKDTRVDIYDLNAVLKNASLQGAAKQSLIDPNLSGSAFFVGNTADIITSDWNNRVLRWHRTSAGYVSEEIYTGDYPILYAEPSKDEKWLLMVEDYGGGDVGGILYSLSAQSKWMDIVDNYKWIGVAFTSDDGIVFGSSNWAEENSDFMTVNDLSTFVSEARKLVSSYCLPTSGDDYTKSACWPDLAAE